MRNPKFLGVFSKNNGARRGKARPPFYFVWELDNASYAVQELDKSFAPIGSPSLYPAWQVQAEFHIEPSLLVAPVSTPDLAKIKLPGKKTPVAADDGAMAELEKQRKARQVENDMRDDFGKAIRALKRTRDRKGAIAALEKMAVAREGIVPAHKHMFRDFGVSLRKKSMPDLALLFAKRTVELAPNDDHAHFNIARILSILGLYDEARAHLKRAISLDASESVYNKLDTYIQNEQAEAFDHKK